MSRIQLVRDYLALALGEGVSKIAGFAAFAWLARVLTTEGYGAVELAVALSMFFALVVDAGLGPIGAREIARDPARVGTLAALVPSARIAIAAVAAPAMALTALTLGQPPATVALIAWFAAGLLFAPWAQRWLLQGLDRMAWVSGAQALRMVVFAAGVVVLVRAPEDLLWVGGVEVVAAGAMALYFIVLQAATVTPVRLSFALGELRPLGREALPVGVEQLLWALNQYLPTVLVALLLDSSDLAWFGGAHRIVLALGSFVFIYHFNLYPTLARRAGEDADAVAGLVGPSFRVTAWLSIGAAMFLALLATPLVTLAFGEGFAGAARPFAWLIFVLPVSLLSGHARFALIASGHQRQELVAQAIGAVVTIAVGVAAIAWLGILGGAIAMLASGAVVWGVAHRYACRHVAPFPLLGPVWRPAASAGCLAGGALSLGLSPLLGASLAAAAFALLAPLLDPALLADVRRLAGAKAMDDHGAS